MEDQLIFRHPGGRLVNLLKRFLEQGVHVKDHRQVKWNASKGIAYFESGVYEKARIRPQFPRGSHDGNVLARRLRFNAGKANGVSRQV